MNIRQMRYILEIAKEGNITAAASNLFISQPSLSILLSNVEKELGAQLIDRSSNPLTLTYAGEKYVKAATKILGTLNELRQEIEDLNDSIIGQLRVGSSPQQSPFTIPEILPVIRENYPGIDFHLTEESPGTLKELLLNGSLDVLLCNDSIGHPNIVCIPLVRQQIILLAPQGSHVPTFVRTDKKAYETLFPCADLSRLSGEPFVLMKKKHNLRTKQDEVLTAGNCQPNVILETSNWQTCLRMVKGGMAYSLLPYVEAEIPTGLPLYSLEHTAYRQIILAHRKDAPYSKVMDAFVSTAQQVLA